MSTNPYYDIIAALLDSPDNKLSIAINVTVSAFRRGLTKAYREYSYANAAAEYAMGLLEEIPETIDDYEPTRRIVISEGNKQADGQIVVHLSLLLPEQIKSSKFTSKLQFTVVQSGDNELDLSDLGDTGDGDKTI